MPRYSRRTSEIFNLSFLDIISCGFGAIVLLLLVSKTGIDNNKLSEVQTDIQLLLNEQNKFKLLSKRKNTLENQDNSLKNKKIDIQNEISEKSKIIKEIINSTSVIEKVNNDLLEKSSSIKISLQNTTKDNERDEEVGGIPVDSEYIIFIIDTSGSMLRIWDRVMLYVEEIINIHPTVKGFKIVNDQGVSMGASDNYLIDTKTYRKGAIAQLKQFQGQSSSNPVNGILKTLRNIRSGEKTSLYVIGDDYSMYGSKEFNDDLNLIYKTNIKLSGKKKARIHGIGFISPEGSSLEFSKFMRALTQENNGTFLALSD